MVLGRSIAVTATPGINQCAEIIRIARGFSMEAPTEAHARVYWLDVSAFIGFPCPKKIAEVRIFTGFPSKHPVSCYGRLGARAMSIWVSKVRFHGSVIC